MREWPCSANWATTSSQLASDESEEVRHNAAWALGIEARSRALLTDGPSAEAIYEEAVERLRIRPVSAMCSLKSEGRRFVYILE